MWLDSKIIYIFMPIPLQSIVTIFYSFYDKILFKNDLTRKTLKSSRAKEVNEFSKFYYFYLSSLEVINKIFDYRRQYCS